MGDRPPPAVAGALEQLLVQHAPDALIATSLEGELLFWNPGAEALFGFTVDEAKGRRLVDLLVPAEEVAEAEAQFERVRREGQAQFEAVRRHRDGASVHVDVVMRKVLGSDGTPIVVVSKKDLSQLRRLQAAQVVEAKFRGLLEAAPDGMIIVAQGGRIEIVNQQVEQLFGYQRDELLGQRIEMLVPERFRGSHPGHRQAYFGDPRTRPMGAGLELFALRKDGSEFPAEISLALLETPEGRFVTAAIRDTTERKRAEDKFRGLLEAAPDAMVIVKQDGRIVLVNAQAERMFGYERAELIGQPIELLVPDRMRGRHPEHRSSYFGAPKPRPMGAGLDLFARRKDGSEFVAEISLSPIVTPEGTLVTAAVRDVTERKRDMDEQNRRMQEASRLKSEFLANMSHELRTPLNAIIGFTSILHAGKAGQLSDTQREYLGDILGSSRHLLQLINDVLDLAKIESGKMDVEVAPVDLATLVKEVRDILRGLAAEKRIQILSAVSSELGEVVLDARKLKQVLYNYLSNAIKFTPDNGRVQIRISPHGPEQLIIEVEDSGIGIKVEDMHRLFVEFQQLDAGASKRYPGTGLGLALTKRLVEAQSGQVRVASVVGQGSTFAAILPRVLELASRRSS